MDRRVIFSITDTYTKFFSWLPKMPNYWDCATHRMVVASKPELTPTAISCIIPMFFLSFLPKVYHALNIIYTTYRLRRYPHEDFYASTVQWAAITAVVIGMGSALAVCSVGFMFHYTIVGLCNCILNLEENLLNRQRLKSRIRTETSKINNGILMKNLGYVGPLVTLYIGPAIVLYGVWARQDPFHYTLRKIIGFQSDSRWIILFEYVTSFILISWGTAVSFQILIGCGILLLVGGYFFVNNLRMVDGEFSLPGSRVPVWNKLRIPIINYNTLFLIVQVFLPVAVTMTLWAVYTSGCACVCTGYLIITAYERLPHIVYYTVPVFLFMLLSVTNTLLLIVASVEERCNDILRRWKSDPVLNMEKSWRRRVTAMRSMRMYMGIWRTNMIQIDKSLCSDFNMTVVNKIASLLLT